MTESIEKILASNWLTIYDALSPKEYEAIDEKEEILQIRKEDEHHE